MEITYRNGPIGKSDIIYELIDYSLEYRYYLYDNYVHMSCVEYYNNNGLNWRDQREVGFNVGGCGARQIKRHKFYNSSGMLIRAYWRDITYIGPWFLLHGVVQYVHCGGDISNLPVDVLRKMHQDCIEFKHLCNKK